MKRPTTISSANGAVPYQPRATPWVCPPIYHQPCQGEPSPIKAENPCNRASSRHIKASAQKHPSPWSLVVLWSLEVGIWSFPAPSPLRLCVKNPAIVLNQGLSRQTMNIWKPCRRAPTARPHTSPGQRPGFTPPMPRAPKGRPIPQSRQKTPVIVHDQGSSRHPPTNTCPLGAWWFSGAWRLEFGASRSHPLCVCGHRAFALKPQQSRLIVPPQGNR